MERHMVWRCERLTAVLSIVVEPRVDTGAHNVNVLRVLNHETPRGVAAHEVGLAAASTTVAVVRVAPHLQALHGEGRRRLGVGLIVRGLGLDHAGEYVSGIKEVVLVEDGVLGSRAVEPGWRLALDEPATGNVD